MLNKKDICDLLEELGTPNASYWADKEKTDKTRAILAMMRFLRPLQKTLDEYLYNYDEWIENIKRCKDDTLKAEIDEMIKAGVSNEVMGKFAYWIARTAFNKVLYRLDDPAGADYDLKNEGEELPRWTLKEVIVDSEKGHYTETGKSIYGMHSVFPLTSPEEKIKKNNL
jgi:hypothetical protein